MNAPRPPLLRPVHVGKPQSTGPSAAAVRVPASWMASHENGQGVSSLSLSAAKDLEALEAEMLLCLTVRLCPGVHVRAALEAVSARVQLRHQGLVGMLRHLTDEGVLVRRCFGRRHLLFEPCEDLEEWWPHVAALRNENLQALYQFIKSEQGSLMEACHGVQKVLGWPPGTTKKRLYKLIDAGLVRQDLGVLGKRTGTVSALEPHPIATEIMRCERDNQLLVSGR